MIEQLIASVAERVGLPHETAAAAAHVLLGLIQQHAAQGQFAQLVQAIPGASQFLAAPAPASPTASAGDNLLGGLLGSLGGMIGGGTGEALGVAGKLQSAGLDVGQVAPFIQSFMGQAENHAGPELMQSIAQHIPGIGDLLK